MTRHLPPGRPPLLPEERLSLTVGVHLTPAAAAALRERARDVGLTVSEYLRHAAFARPLPPPVPAVNRKLWEDLARVGGNLNQAMHAVNSGSLPIGFEADLAELQRLLRETRALLLGQTSA